MEDNFTYGPIRPAPETDFTDNRAEAYVRGYALKIIYDLDRQSRIYSGYELEVHRAVAGERCEVCTDTITGAVVLSNCPTCKGAGTQGGFENLGSFWVHMDVTPRYKVASPVGNTENPGGARTPMAIINAPLLKDQDLLVTSNTREIYKIIDVEPQIVAMQAFVITQLAHCSLLSRGSREYRILT